MINDRIKNFFENRIPWKVHNLGEFLGCQHPSGVDVAVFLRKNGNYHVMVSVSGKIIEANGLFSLLEDTILTIEKTWAENNKRDRN